MFLEHYGNTEHQLAEEYGPYERNSAFVALLNESGQALAACRLIAPGAAGLKSVNDIARAPWHADAERVTRAAGLDLTYTWDVATIAVHPAAGRTRAVAAAAMYHGLWTAARVNRVKSIVMIMDERARRLLGAATIITQALPGTHAAEYLGSRQSTPLYGHLAAMAEVQRRLNPDAHRLIALGVGLDGIDVPPAQGFALRDRAGRAARIDARPAPALSA